MKALVLTSFLLALAVSASSQLDYFISIDADGGQPFSVMIGRKIWSSDAQGHLIIPQLKDSVYRLRVNFPRNEYPELLFDITLGKRDKGFELKKSGSQSWSLYDWQRLELIAIASDQQAPPVQQPVFKRTDPLANLLAGTVNDSAVLLTSTTTPRPIEKDTLKTKPLQTIDTTIQSLTTPKLLNPPVQLLVDKSTTLGRQLVYAIMEGEIMQEAIVLFIALDNSQETVQIAPSPMLTDTTTSQVVEPKTLPDTILPDTSKPMLVPKNDSIVVHEALLQKDSLLVSPSVLSDSSPVFKDTVFKDTVNNSIQNQTDSSLIQKDSTLTSVPVVLPNQPDSLITSDTLIVSGTLLEMSSIVDSLSKKPITVDSAIAVKATLPPIIILNSDCLNFASETDVDKLRVKLLDASGQENRLALVKKAFKSKCHSAKQARALSEVFNSEEEKLEFLELAYPFISDTGSFKLLVDLFTQPENANKFKKMVRM